MRDRVRIILGLGLVLIATACGGAECACGLPDGEVVFRSTESDGGCTTLAAGDSPYEYCTDVTGAASVVGPLDREPAVDVPWGDSAAPLRSWKR